MAVRPVPLERTGLFVRAGSIIPTGPVNQYCDGHPLEEVELHVCPGEGDIHLELIDRRRSSLTCRAADGVLEASDTAWRFNAVVH